MQATKFSFTISSH